MEAQPTTDTTTANRVPTSSDTLQVSGLSEERPDTLHAFVSTKSPGLALALSAVLPGAGQFYNESYWKIPIVAGLGVYLVSEWIQNNDLTQDYRDQFSASITSANPFGDARLLSLREFYKDQRDTFTWYLAILYVANLLDAYVDASLYDFSVSDDLNLQLLPELPSTIEPPRLHMKLTF